MKMKSLDAIALVALTLLVTVGTSATPQEPVVQELNQYKGYKVAPMEIPSTTKYTHEYVDILGSKMAYIDVGEKVTRFYFYMARLHPHTCGEMLCLTWRGKGV